MSTEHRTDTDSYGLTSAPGIAPGLQTRAADLFDMGRRTIYAIEYDTNTTRENATHLNIYLGEQWSGRRLYLLDLDSHTPEQNADAAKAALQAERPELDAKFDWHRSKSGTGWHAYFESSVQIPTGKLYDQAGAHIGELLGKDSDRALDPGNVRIPCLHAGEVERLLNVWHVKGSDPKGERWADRAKQGERYTRGYTRIHVPLLQLRSFLTRECGPSGKDADALFDTDTPFNRSNAAGNLMQTLMLWAHKLPCGRGASFVETAAYVMAYWMAADSYGKAGEKGYTQEKDGWSLIAQIVNEDPYIGKDGKQRHWRAPFWAKSHATVTPAPAPKPDTPRPAHRPTGDRAQHLATFRRVLNAIEPDAFGRRTYTLAYLANKMKVARCAAAPRTIQSYLRTLRDNGEIVTAQISGNGMPYAVLKPCFGGADNYQKPGESEPKPDIFGDANACAVQPIATLQSAESSLQCKGDHQNPSAPAAAPAAPPAPAIDEWAGIDVELDAWERTTDDGRHFVKLKKRWEATAEDIVQLASVLRPAWRGLLEQVRSAAGRANEPLWHQRDYDAMSVAALTLELRRLQGADAPAGAPGFGVPLRTTPKAQQARLL